MNGYRYSEVEWYLNRTKHALDTETFKEIKYENVKHFSESLILTESQWHLSFLRERYHLEISSLNTSSIMLSHYFFYYL